MGRLIDQSWSINHSKQRQRKEDRWEITWNTRCIRGLDGNDSLVDRQLDRETGSSIGGDTLFYRYTVNMFNFLSFWNHRTCWTCSTSRSNSHRLSTKSSRSSFNAVDQSHWRKETEGGDRSGSPQWVNDPHRWFGFLWRCWVFGSLWYSNAAGKLRN